jgi:hypothetical protein
MSQVLARVTCPNCKQVFATPLEQIMDVEVDPGAKTRLLSGQVNMVVCPHCGMAGGLGLPFFYHDPAKELALVFMPMEAGQTDLERQRAVGQMSRAVMEQMPPEQRKGYLLNPQLFLSIDALIKRVLEADGITQEMIDGQRAKIELLQRLLEVPSEEERMDLLHDNEESLDEEFFYMFQVNLEQARLSGREDVLQQLADLRTILLEQTPVGRRVAARTEAGRALQAEPTREKLVELLVAAEDEETRAALIAFGQPLLDYFFFQALTQRIEAAPDGRERERLEAVRDEVMDVREQLRQEARGLVERRRALLRDLMLTERPDLLARRRMADMDELFFSLLVAEIEEARKTGDGESVSQLEQVLKVTRGALKDSMPPELLLIQELVDAADEDEARKLFEENPQAVGPVLLQMLEQVEAQMRERGQTEAAKRAGVALGVLRTMLPPEERVEDKQRPSGLVMA